MLNPGAYENSAPDGFGVLEVCDDGKGPRRFVPLKRTEVRGEVVGPLATLCLTQRFGFTREQCDRVLETAYRFPLPGDAAVTAVRVQFGDVEIHTELKERHVVVREYDEAKEQGRQAVMVTQESPNVLTLQVAGIQPDQDVTVETDYAQRARAEGAGWTLRIPLTTAPRYAREDEQGSRAAQGQPLLLMRDPGHRFTLDLKLRGAGEVSSPTHALAVSRDEDLTCVQLRDGEVLPDRDCVLNWQPLREPDRPTFQIWRHDETPGDQVYFLALLAPPAVPEPGAGIAREVILLVDHSGSMEGAKWAAADWAVKKFLSELTEGDQFNLGLFHDTTRWFAKRPQPATADTVARAVQFLEEHRDSGGTQLGPALEQALRQQRAPGEIARHVLLLTDAQVTDEGRILRLADAEAERADRRRVSVLCIDAAPNADLALELAERGAGVARFLTSDPEEGDITTALDEVLADWAQPLLTGLEMEVSRPAVQCVGRTVQEGEDEESSRIDLGDLPTGRTLWLAGRFPRGGVSEVTFRVTAPPRREVKARRVDLTGREDRPAIRTLFGARRMLALEHLAGAAYFAGEMTPQLERLGYGPKDLATDLDPSSPVYAENVRIVSEEVIQKLLVRESLAFGLISSETGFIAVRTEPGKPVEESVLVANALPAGWSDSILGMGLACAAPVALCQLATPDVGLGAMGMLADSEAASPPPAMLQRAASAPARAARARGKGKQRSGACRLFSGVPALNGGQAVLFDTARAEDAGKLSGETTITAVKLRFPQGAPDPASLDPGLTLLLFVDDLSQPRAKVRLTDLLRQGGERPLNLRLRSGQRMQLVLQDTAGAWLPTSLPIEVELDLG